MIKMILTTAAIVAACMLCCIPLLVPAVAGLPILGWRLAGSPLSLESLLCALAPALLVGVAAFALLKSIKKPAKARCGNAACASSGGCGCR